MNNNKIFSNLWFNANKGKISNVLAYYKNIFNENFEAGNIIQLGQTPSGNTEMCIVKIFQQKYSLMNTEKAHHTFNEAVSFTINCEDQIEIDKYWDYFTKEGMEVQCGWCTDKYGLSWQILPKNFNELMLKPNAWQVMMQQKKIVISEY